jgi:hypothetical protein
VREPLCDQMLGNLDESDGFAVTHVDTSL